jgi:ATP-dependent protease ClpP protease subunit
MSKRALPQAYLGANPKVRSDFSAGVINRWNPDVRLAGDDGDASISILDPIGADWFGEGVTVKRIAAALRSIGDRDVSVLINSPGGDYFEGLAIYNALREHKGAVNVKILGLAASAASVIAMAGDTVQIARAGFLMIHNAWAIAAGDRHAMREVADWLEPFDAAAVDIYAARTGLDRADLAAMLDRETWIGGQAAVDQGFAEELLDADKVDASARQEGGKSLRAEKKFEILAARAGLSRSEGREILAGLKSGKLDAAQNGKPDAAVLQEVASLLERVKQL